MQDTNKNGLSNKQNFIEEKDIIRYCQDSLGKEINHKKLKLLISLGIIPTFKVKEDSFVLIADIKELLYYLNHDHVNEASKFMQMTLLGDDQDSLIVGTNTVVDLEVNSINKGTTFYSALRNLLSVHDFLSDVQDSTELRTAYFSESWITTYSRKVNEFVISQLDRNAKINAVSKSHFARSAHYMGSKKQLCGFLVEAISSILPTDGVVVDLMCGSGVASGAFNRVWETYSSDVQEFSQALAVIHGGGIDRPVAKDIISRLLPVAKDHFASLNKCLADFIEVEDSLFCRDLDEALLDEYGEFVKKLPTLANSFKDNGWDPSSEVAKRRKSPKKIPYCLFTAYFSNVYFGLRQCVEIDSLRYSIEQLTDENEKTWAMGALITTLSTLGTTYGGHFAQPATKNYEDMTLNRLSHIINTRVSSITHEFSVRLLNLSEQGQNSPRSVEVVSGPWQRSLATLDDKIKNRDVLVYVDPPYKREEYSRYYHVLETLVSYSYPSCTGKGLTPKPGERFRSEFFTKTESKVKDALSCVISSILQRGWACAWSYSDSSAANTHDVINDVVHENHCNIKSYSVPFVHKSQGGARPKRVKEYLIIFTPKK